MISQRKLQPGHTPKRLASRLTDSLVEWLNGRVAEWLGERANRPALWDGTGRDGMGWMTGVDQ